MDEGEQPRRVSFIDGVMGRTKSHSLASSDSAPAVQKASEFGGGITGRVEAFRNSYRFHRRVPTTVKANTLDLSSAVVDPLMFHNGNIRRAETEIERQLLKIPLIGGHVSRFASWWLSIQEPERDGFLARLIRSYPFQAFSIFVICLNGVFILWTTDHAVNNPDQDEDPIVNQLDLMFLIYYAFELMLKICVHRLYFFANVDMAWNWFDFFLVLISAVEFIVLSSAGGKQMKPTYLRSFRLFRVSKIARMFRALRFVNELRILLDSLLGCLVTLFWSLVLMAFLLCLFSIYFVQMGTGYAQESGQDLTGDQWEQFNALFGSVQLGMITLFWATSGGDWMPTYLVLCETGVFNGYLFMFFVLFFLLTVYNIIVSVFVQKAMKAAAPTLIQAMEEQRWKDREYVEELLQLLMSDVDLDCNGRVQMAEFVQAMRRNGRMRAFLALNGLDIKDTATFFDMIASARGTETVDYSSFLAACVRLRGTASSLDLNMVSYELKLLAVRQSNFQDSCEMKLEAISRALGIHQQVDRLVGAWARRPSNSKPTALKGGRDAAGEGDATHEVADAAQPAAGQDAPPQHFINGRMRRFFIQSPRPAPDADGAASSGDTGPAADAAAAAAPALLSPGRALPPPPPTDPAPPWPEPPAALAAAAALAAPPSPAAPRRKPSLDSAFSAGDDEPPSAIALVTAAAPQAVHLEVSRGEIKSSEFPLDDYRHLTDLETPPTDVPPDAPEPHLDQEKFLQLSKKRRSRRSMMVDGVDGLELRRASRRSIRRSRRDGDEEPGSDSYGALDGVQVLS